MASDQYCVFNNQSTTAPVSFILQRQMDAKNSKQDEQI